jgi:hypothetical protein
MPTSRSVSTSTTTAVRPRHPIANRLPHMCPPFLHPYPPRRGASRSETSFSFSLTPLSSPPWSKSHRAAALSPSLHRADHCTATKAATPCVPWSHHRALPSSSWRCRCFSTPSPLNPLYWAIAGASTRVVASGDGLPLSMPRRALHRCGAHHRPL